MDRQSFFLQTYLHQPIWELSLVSMLAAILNSSDRNAVTIQQIGLATGGKNVKMYTKIINP
jgi:hypothetical protein